MKCINNGLTGKDHTIIFEKNKSFEYVITDKNWYFVNWKYDITIQSAITMLDEIHHVFKGTSVSFSDLTDNEKPCIVFNFLDIKNFGLSDDLYIKMNSRGKPLTNFENLKAELGKFIELSDFNDKYDFSLKHSSGIKKVNVETYFVTKIDTYWSDYFWNIRNKETNEYDDKLLNLLAFISLNDAVTESADKFDKWTTEFDKEGSEMSYYKFKQAKLLNENSIISYIKILDLLVSREQIVIDYLNDEEFLNKTEIIKSSFESNYKGQYQQRVLFYAIFKFIVDHNSTLNLKELKKWDRLIRNIVVNTIYNSSKDFHDSVLGIDALSKAYTGDIYQDFFTSDIKGFDNLQVREEKLKINLLQKSQNWEEVILEAESHKYLNGQISFLFVFSGVYDKYLENQINFDFDTSQHLLNLTKEYFSKFKALFRESGLREFKDELFRRALLAKGDYRLHSTNFSLVIDNDRDISWKRLFRETANKTSEYFQNKCFIMKALFDDVNVDSLEKSLQTIINGHTALIGEKILLKIQ